MYKLNIVFIGGGNMARALISGLIADSHDPRCLWATAPHKKTLEKLQADFGVQVTQSNLEGIRAANVVVFTVKPQVLKSVAMEIANLIKIKRPLVISVAAGIREADIQRWLGGKTAIVRCMPNMAAQLRCSATALYANSYVSPVEKNCAEALLRSVGNTVWLEDESQLDTVTALSGSGLAYFFYMMEALEQAAVAQGLPISIAHSLTLQTALGAARVALENKFTLANLRHNVTSSGGTTEKALNVLTAGNMASLFASALQAAKQRAHELAQSFGE
jgi:pyrroline-5-carboxylate reductase